MHKKDRKMKTQVMRLKGYKGNSPIDIVQRTNGPFKRAVMHRIVDPRRVIAVDTESGYYERFNGELRTALISVCSYVGYKPDYKLDGYYVHDSKALATSYKVWRDNQPLLVEKIGHKPHGWSKLQQFDMDEADEKARCTVDQAQKAFSSWRQLDKNHELITLIMSEREEYPIIALFDYLFPLFAVPELNSTQTKQRKRRMHKDGGFYRDGRRVTIDPVYVAFYNMSYDISRLFRKNVQFMRAIQLSTEDSVRIQVGPYEIELNENRCYTDTPSFEWYIRRDRYVMRIIGRDLWSYDKTGLDAFSEKLLHIGKDELSDDEKELLFESAIDRTFRENRALQEKWERYAAHDVRITFECLAALILALSEISYTFVMRNGFIPRSAPGCAARIAWSMASLPEWERPNQEIQQFGALTYAGARAFTVKPGRYDSIWVYDISSAYPHVMSLLPDPCTVEYEKIGECPFNFDRFMGKWGVLCISGRGLDKVYPALRTHDTRNKRLRYIYGDFAYTWATIPEIVIGVASERLRVDQVHTGFIMHGSNEESFLRKFVMKMYDLKKHAEKDSPLYLLSKLMMNSLYGKLCEVNLDTTGYAKDFEIAKCLIVPITRKEGKIENWHDTLQAYVQGGVEGLMNYADEYNASLEKWEEREYVPFGTLYKNQQKSVGIAGQYFMPMYASQITGFTSAKLGLAAYCSRATNGHTDSLFCDHDASYDIQCAMDLIELCGYEAFNIHTGLGRFDCEVAGKPATIVRHNLYVVYKGDGRVKLAKHGIVHAQKDDIVRIIEELYDKGKAHYKTRKTPVKLKQAARYGLEPGTFTSSERVRKVEIDENMEERNGTLVWKKL
jgi:hypothetical protein